MLTIHNLARFPHTLPGGVGHPDDRAIVTDDNRTELHVITRQPQPCVVYRGTLAGAHAYVQAQQGQNL